MKLQSDDSALFINSSNEKKIGHWTMVYDEGFDIILENFSFFAFSKYSPDKFHKWVSKCYSTLIGWYHQGDEWGCFYAEKQGEDPEEQTSTESTGGVLVVEGTVKEKDTSFMEDSLSVKLQNSNALTAMSHDEVVEKINTMQNMWSATNYNEFSNMSIRELNNFAGRKKHSPHSKKNPHNKINSFDEWLETATNIKKNLKNSLKNRKNSLKNNDGFPKEFLKWVPYMSNPRNQGKCGSCYAVATINMLEARLRIKFSHNVRLSLNHILKCSVYNQGCDGGYSYLALKFASEVELIPESCENKGVNDSYNCHKKCNSEILQKRVYKVRDYKYLGGSYGKCSEKLLMQELMENGPVVVSFEPDYHFMMYRKGIYKSLDDKDWMPHRLPKPEWEKVDHSVTLVGWGYDEKLKEKYWLLLNSWGENWGENGFFKMVKGVDHLGIESICEVGNIYYVDN